MLILVVSCVRNWSEKKIMEVFSKRHWEYFIVNPYEISISIYDENPKFLFRNTVIKPDICYIKRSAPELDAVYHIALSCEKVGIPVIEKSSHYSVPLSKMASIIDRQTKIPVPKSALLYSLDSAEYFLKNVKYPLITKPLAGKSGEGVKLLNSYNDTIFEAERSLTNEGRREGLFVQEYLSIKSEYRVLTIGADIVAVCEKIKMPGKIAANRAQGAKFIKGELNEDDIKLIKNVINVSGVEIAGIDLTITDNGSRFILEVNRNPDFRGVEEAWSELDVAERIADHLLYLFKNRNK